VVDLGEPLLDGGEQRCFCPALQDLGNKGAVRGEDLCSEGKGDFAKSDDPEMVGLCVAGRRRCHVAHYHIGGTAKSGFESVRRFIGKEIEIYKGRAGDRINRCEVERDYLPAIGAGPNAFDRYLGPAARGGAQVDDPPAGGEKAELIVEADEFEGGARTIAQAFGFADIGVVQLTVEPSNRREFAALGGLDPDR
jgi:hypothetical protein